MKTFKTLLLLAANFAIVEKAQAAPAAILARVSGQVEVLRGAQKLAGRDGLQLQNGDRVSVRNGAATIYSLNGPPKTLQTGSFTVGSSSAKSTSPMLWKSVYNGLNRGLNRNDRRVALTMRPEVIEPISPLPTLIESERPRFEWRAGALDTPRYEVFVSNSAQKEIWRGQTDKTFLDYPATAPKLSGALLWKVIPLRNENGVWKPITDWASRAVSFQIATPQQLQNVRSQLAALSAQSKGISKTELALLRASLWNEQGFNLNALRELEAAGNDETVRVLRRDLWLQTGQNWRIKAETRVANQPIGGADAALLKFAPDTPLSVSRTKEYVAPDGRFSLKIPSSFAVFAFDVRKIKLYDFGGSETSRTRLSLTCGDVADFPVEGGLLEHLGTFAVKKSDFMASTPTTFRGQKALLSRWQTAGNAKGPVSSGAVIEWREAGRVWLAAWSGDKANAEALKPLFNSLRISSAAQPFKGPVPKKAETVVALQEFFNATSEANIAELTKSNERLQERALDEPPTNNDLISATEFERLDKLRLATAPHSYARSSAALKASRLAGRLAWISSEKSEMLEAKRWFELRTKLDNESYTTIVAALKNDMKADDEKLAQFLNLTPPTDAVFAYSVAMSGLFSLKVTHLKLWNTLALSRGDIPALERTYRDLALINRLQLEVEQLSDPTEARLLSAKRTVAGDFDNLAYAAQQRADLDGARAYYSRALDWRRSLPESYLRRGLIETLRYRAALESELGDIRLARSFYEQTITEIDRIRTKSETEIQAEPDEQLRAFQWSDWVQTRAQTYNNIALVVWALGDFSAAENYLKKALETIDPLPTTGFVGSVRAAQRASTLNNLAVYYADTGDSAKGEQYLNQAIEFYRAWGDDANQAFTLLNSAGNNYGLGQYDVALSKVEQARSIFAQMQSSKNIVIADVLTSKVEFKRGNKEKAVAVANNALVLARTLGDAAWIGSAARSLANFQIESAKTPLTPEAKAHITALIEEAARADERAGDVLSRVKTLVVRAALAEKNGDLSGAYGFIKNAITLNEQIRATTGANSNYSEVKKNYQQYETAVRLLIQLNRPEEAFDMMGRARSKKLVDSLSQTALQSNDPALQKLLQRSAALDQKLFKTRAQLASEVSQPLPQRDNAKIDNLRDLIATTQAEFFDVSTQIKSRNPRFEKAVSLSPRELKKAQRAIPEGTVLLQYAPLDDGLYVFAVTRDSLKIYAPKVSKAELGQAIRVYRGAIDADIARLEKGETPSSFDDVNSPLRSASEKLSKWLLDPVQSEVDAAKTVAFIPSGQLFYVPFHALGETDKNGKWHFLIERKPVAYLMSGDVLSVATERDESREGQGVLAMGDPTGANLPAARSEVESIARIFPASRALVGSDASKVTLLQPANLSKRVVHLAAHGVLDSARPDQSFIQLSPNGKDDGKLRVGEIYGLNLNHVDLVTLSACQTAIGEGEPDGTEISSLAQSFSTAGTPSVVASLWNVEDGSTSQLMEKFYSSLTQGTPKGIALQKAQIALLNDPKTRHPAFWAPFELLGDWR